MGSTGDDGKLTLWRREPSGVWSKSAELAMNQGVVSLLEIGYSWIVLLYLYVYSHAVKEWLVSGLVTGRH